MSTKNFSQHREHIYECLVLLYRFYRHSKDLKDLNLKEQKKGVWQGRGVVSIHKKVIISVNLFVCIYLICSLQKTLWVHGADISLVSFRNSDLPCRRQVRELQKNTGPGTRFSYLVYPNQLYRCSVNVNLLNTLVWNSRV